MKGLLKENSDSREIGGLGFVQANIFFPKLDEIITHNKDTTNHSTGEGGVHVLHLVEYVSSSNDDIMIVLKE